jgi:hypothetical protein
MTDKSIRECYGFAVECVADAGVRDVVDQFFGAPVGERPAPPVAAAPTVRLTIELTEDVPGPKKNPPHTVELMADNPIEMDTGASRATVDPDNWSVHTVLSTRDLDDPVLWGHWLLERAFLYLVCRSPRHYPLHAGAISVNGRSAVVSGPTGMGKSVFGYWAHRGGADLISEDIMVRHLDDEPGRVWGYPHAVYLDSSVRDLCPELADAATVDYNDGARFRLGLAHLPQERLRSAAGMDAMVFLARGECAAVREIDVDDAVKRCWDDVSTAKKDTAVLEEVSEHLRRELAAVPIWELSVPPGIEAGYDLLRAELGTL